MTLLELAESSSQGAEAVAACGKDLARPAQELAAHGLKARLLGTTHDMLQCRDWLGGLGHRSLHKGLAPQPWPCWCALLLQHFAGC